MKIFFAVLILICAVFYIMYLWDFSLILLIIIAAVPVLMFITAYITKKMISVELTSKEDSAAKHENFPIQINISNRSIFPVGKAEAHIEYYNVFNNEINSFELMMPVQPLNSQSVTFLISSHYCGMIHIKCAYINIYDPLKIFRFKIGKNISTEVAVLPEGHEITGEVSYTDRVNEESSVFSEHKPGDDPSEVFDLRGYHPGDKLNRIHWKLSSKKDEFIVKDYSLPVDTPCTIFLDMKNYGNNSNRMILPVFDTLVETLVSVSQFMIENERVHNVVFFNAKRSRFSEHIINDADDLSAAVHELVFSVKDNLFCQEPRMYFIEKGELSLSSFTFISSQPDSPVFEHIEENIDADIKNALIVLPSPEKKLTSAGAYSEINMIPVYMGRISSSVKDIEL